MARTKRTKCTKNNKLKKKGIGAAIAARPQQQLVVVNATQAFYGLRLSWPCKRPYTSTNIETQLLPILLWKKKEERGMMKDISIDRQRAIEQAAQTSNIPLSLALSLRREHIKNRNPCLSYTRLRLGEEADILKSEAILEASVEQYLKENSIPFIFTKMQQELPKTTCEAQLASSTPSFLFETPIWIVHHGIPLVNYSFEINWIDVRHSYGASSLSTHNNNSTLGCIQEKSQMYRRRHGPGAVVFAYGAGEQLARSLLQMGIIVLDCGPIQMESLQAHLQSWCADENGIILP